MHTRRFINQKRPEKRSGALSQGSPATSVLT
jgi:hypothetical protein